MKFTVHGSAQPAGSKRAFKHPHTGALIVTDANKKSKPWKQEVASAAAALFGEPIEGPVRLTLTFYRARPKGHYGTGRRAGVVKDSAPPFPVTRPDTTKLLRGVEDALTGICWRDDAQVVDQHAFKRYGLPERCEIEVQAIAMLAEAAA